MSFLNFVCIASWGCSCKWSCRTWRTWLIAGQCGCGAKVPLNSTCLLVSSLLTTNVHGEHDSHQSKCFLRLAFCKMTSTLIIVPFLVRAAEWVSLRELDKVPLPSWWACWASRQFAPCVKTRQLPLVGWSPAQGGQRAWLPLLLCPFAVHRLHSQARQPS